MHAYKVAPVWYKDRFKLLCASYIHWLLVCVLLSRHIDFVAETNLGSPYYCCEDSLDIRFIPIIGDTFYFLCS